MPVDAFEVERYPNLVAVLPLLYIAWADGELSNAELAELRSIYSSEDSALSAVERDAIRAWLDPANPPDVSLLTAWRETIARFSDKISAESLNSLVSFGEALGSIARTSDAQTDSDLPSTSRDSVHPKTLKALAEVVEILGLGGDEPVSRFIQQNPALTVAEDGSSSSGLTAILQGDQANLRQSVLDLLAGDRFANAPDDVTAYRDWVRDRIVDLADAGFGSLGYPVEAGGQNNMRSFVTVFETLAYFDLSVVIKFGVQFGLFGGSIHQLGSKRHHTELLPAIGQAKLLGCFAMSELGHGSNVRDLRTTATYDPDRAEFVIHTPDDNARKEWIGNAACHGQLATVFAQLIVKDTSYGVHAFTVPIRTETGKPTEGVRLEDCGHKMGLNGVDNGRIWFNHVRIPVTALLDRFASIDESGEYSSPIASDGKRFFTMLGTLVGGRISVACAGLSATKTALTIAIRYSSVRRQFGPKGSKEVSLLSYRTQQRRLLPSLAVAYGLHFALHKLADDYAANDTEENHQEIEVQAAALKSFGTWHTTSTIQECREACGGQGYLSINRFDSIKADTDVFATFEGDNTVLMLQVAKGLLSSYRQQFHDMNWLMVARFVADRAASSIRDRNPIAARNTSSSHLRSAEFQHGAMDFREQSLLASLAQRLKARIDGGMDSFNAVVECQDHMVSLADAHAKRLVLEQFIAIEKGTEEPEVIHLTALRQLCGLHFLESDRAWFLEQNYFEGAKSKAIRTEVNRLCAEIRPSAVNFVDAFDIPDSILRAPIGLSGYPDSVTIEK